VCCSCGCGLIHDDHGDSRNITIEDLRAAADAANESLACAAHNIESVVMHQFAAKGASGDVGCRVIKASDERRYTLGVAYPANRPDVGKAADGFRDFASAEVLEEAAWNFMRKGGRVGLNHADGTEGVGQVVESYIWRGPDWPQGDYVVKSGDWLMGVVWEPTTWAAIKEAKFTGFSPQGAARRRVPSPAALSQLRS
jgi:hypothetical protein